MKKFIKNHRYTCILVLIFILIVILGLKAKDLLVPDEGKATYGERLKDIKKHPISKDDYDKVDEEMKKNSGVTKINHNLHGKTLNYFITFDDKVSVKDAKAVGDKILDYFSDDIKDYYSIQVYLLKEKEELNNFPIIGMKHPESKTISWTKDREIVTESDKDE